MESHVTPEGDEEARAQMSTASINDLPDSDFAYIEPGGEKDSDGKTVPRSLRHFPVHDEAHVRNALSRAPQSPFGDKAMPKIKAAAKKFGIDVADDSQRSRKARKPRHRAIPLSREVRCLRTERLEVRDAGGSGDSVTVTGLPIVYNTPYTVVDAFGEFEERMAPGVADASLANADVRFLVDHDPSRLLARTASGTLRLTDSSEGLRMQATLDLRDTDAQNLMVRIERGDVSQMSCGFIVARDEWNDDMDQRTIQKFADLLDVSAVTYPASPTTSIEVAQRMAMRMEVESRARLRKFTAELRAGKKISQANHSLIASAIDTLNSVIDQAANPTDAAIEDGDGSPDDDGKGMVLPEEPVASMELDEDGDSDGLEGEPLNDPGEQIRASASLLAEVASRRGHRGTQAYRAEKELQRQVKLRIVK